MLTLKFKNGRPISGHTKPDYQEGIFPKAVVVYGQKGREVIQWPSGIPLNEETAKERGYLLGNKTEEVILSNHDWISKTDEDGRIHYAPVLHDDNVPKKKTSSWGELSKW
jgi:hypothetical protein